MTMNELVSKINDQMAQGIAFEQALSEEFPNGDFEAKGWAVQKGWSTDSSIVVRPLPGNPLYQKGLYPTECAFATIKARRKKQSDGHIRYAYCEAKLRFNLSFDFDLVELAELSVCMDNQCGAGGSIANLTARALRLDRELLRMHMDDNIIVMLAKDIESIHRARDSFDEDGGLSTLYHPIASTEGRVELFPALAERINTFLSDHGQPQNKQLKQLSLSIAAARIEALGIYSKLFQVSGDKVVMWTVDQITINRHERIFECSAEGGLLHRFTVADIGDRVFLMESEAVACLQTTTGVGSLNG